MNDVEVLQRQVQGLTEIVQHLITSVTALEQWRGQVESHHPPPSVAAPGDDHPLLPDAPSVEAMPTPPPPPPPPSSSPNSKKRAREPPSHIVVVDPSTSPPLASTRGGGAVAVMVSDDLLSLQRAMDAEIAEWEEKVRDAKQREAVALRRWIEHTGRPIR